MNKIMGKSRCVTTRAAATLLAALLSACAGLPDNMVSPPQEIDYAKINAIEAAARARGVSLYWYRYPTKSVSAAAPGTTGGDSEKRQ